MAFKFRRATLTREIDQQLLKTSFEVRHNQVNRPLTYLYEIGESLLVYKMSKVVSYMDRICQPSFV